MIQRLEECPSTQESPGHAILYCDKIHPGGQLGSKKGEQIQAVHEYGGAALAHEDVWFTITTTRSQLARNIPGGMAKVFGAILEDMFVNGPLADVGLWLGSSGRKFHFFAKLGHWIQNGAAHQTTFHCKGDAGCKLCVCRNLFSQASEVVDEDGSGTLQCKAKDYAELDLAIHDDLKEAVTRLEMLRANPAYAKEEFELIEKALGSVWSPYNLLSDTTLEKYLNVPKPFMHDWMHMMFVTGVFNLTLLFLLEAIKEETRQNVYAVVKEYLSRWN